MFSISGSLRPTAEDAMAVSENNDVMDMSDSDNPQLPIEVIMHIMSYLSVSDRISAGRVCRHWHEASVSAKFVNRQALLISREEDNLQNVMNTLSVSNRPFYHFIFKEIEVKASLPIWSRFGPIMRSLIMVCCDLSERTLVHILKSCTNLQTIHINACRECLMSGRLLDDENDVKEISNNLKSLVELSLASNRYLSDALFNRLISICPNLESLSLTDCQISFHSGLYKKFYPARSSLDQASESVLTFFNVLEYIKKQAKRLKHLSLGRTLIDSTALSTLATVDGLQLLSLKLRSCDQLSNSGLRTLVHQRSLKVLDLSFCTRVTDASLLCICQNLENLETLNIRRCRAVTNYGICQIRCLKRLKELDISECDQLTSGCITQGLCKPNRLGGPNDEEQVWESENINPNSAQNHLVMGQDSFNENLEILSANALNLDEKAIECIAASFKQLKSLDIGYCFSAVTDKTVQKIFKELTAIRKLRISRCDKVSDAGLTGMGAGARDHLVLPECSAEVSRIQEIAGAKLRISLGSRAEEEIVRDANRKREVMEMCEDTGSSLDFDIAPGYSLLRLRGLRELDLAGCNRVTDVSLKHAFTFLELRVLDLSMCQQITHVGLDHLTRNNRAIEDLNLSQCHNVTDVGIQYVVERLHRLKRLHLQTR
ncbi:F-box/LRR-repeat protein 14 isoform X2 [Diachasma alloeum]|uniref:F-box/LRR-repeat protein 14 isoform X2 n=1 Tax=Diachasma alloeum TaxID=454923 RepID=UPI0007381BA8|nr:F-box/LRR-repeat protein 14 isoform X2 [Diachasma alloeum]